MKRPWRSVIVGWPVLLIGTAGCYVPDYHTPKGFSSTFHRRLLESERHAASHAGFPVWAAPGTQAPPESVPRGLEELPAPDGGFLPPNPAP